MHGQDNGIFSLDMQETTGGIITASSTIANVPTTAGTLATLNILNGIDTASALTVDENGDGQNIITVVPEVGETVNYMPPAPAPTPTQASAPTPQIISLPGSISIPIIAPVATTTSATTTQLIASSSPRIVISTKIVRTGKKPSAPTTSPEKVDLHIPQTASVYGASQQSSLKNIGATLYNGLYGFWSALKKLF
jgi:hypothetical protein